MSAEDTATRVVRWSGSLTGRAFRAWRVLPHERRLAAGASLGMFLALFLPWYQETVIAPNEKVPATASLSGWASFSFVEAAVLLVAVFVLTLLFQRAEGKAFHLPGGDGGVIMSSGVWASALVVWRIFDKQSASIHGPGATISGIQWGILVALGVSVLLAYSGMRIRGAHRPEPPLPGEAPTVPSRGPAGPAGPALPGDLRASSGPARDQDETPANDNQPAPSRETPRPASPQRRPVGWLTAKPGRPPQPPGGEDQLTIPLDDE